MWEVWKEFCHQLPTTETKNYEIYNEAATENIILQEIDEKFIKRKSRGCQILFLLNPKSTGCSQFLIFNNNKFVIVSISNLLFLSTILLQFWVPLKTFWINSSGWEKYLSHCSNNEDQYSKIILCPPGLSLHCIDFIKGQKTRNVSKIKCIMQQSIF